jgi:hypothetical protein
MKVADNAKVIAFRAVVTPARVGDEDFVVTPSPTTLLFSVFTWVRKTKNASNACLCGHEEIVKILLECRCTR